MVVSAISWICADQLQVVVAFIASAILLLIALVTGYLTLSFSDDIFDATDLAMAEKFRQWLPKILTRSRPTSPGEETAREQRIDAFTKFLLALGDQQMVTALALLVATFCRANDITVYATNVAGQIAFLSAILSTAVLPIVTTRDRRRRLENLRSEGSTDVRITANSAKLSGAVHGLAKHVRLGITGLNFVGMAILFVLSMGDNWYPVVDYSDLYLLPSMPGSNWHVGSTSVVAVTLWSSILLSFVLDYLDAICCLYTADVFLVDFVVRTLSRKWGLVGPPTEPDRKLWMPMAKEYAAGQDTVISDAIKFSNKHPRLRWIGQTYFGIRRKMVDESFAFFSYRESFLNWSVVTAIYGLTLSTGWIWIVRDGPNATLGMSGERNTWGESFTISAAV